MKSRLIHLSKTADMPLEGKMMSAKHGALLMRVRKKWGSWDPRITAPLGL